MKPIMSISSPKQNHYPIYLKHVFNIDYYFLYNMNDYNQTYHQIIHYYNIWNDYAFLIPIICVAIVLFVVLWCCICPVYRFFRCLCCCCRRKHSYQRLDEHQTTWTNRARRFLISAGATLQHTNKTTSDDTIENTKIKIQNGYWTRRTRTTLVWFPDALIIPTQHESKTYNNILHIYISYLYIYLHIGE